ncbi:PREDICTED: transcription factor CP2-like protein 1 isoform X3 [Myotis brandtii]|uniref:transcription factor CP2-like protein 1 isoform X3 n=1 Tax=Myotis brandtii TaxID=109478 RepID=UPI0007041D94|nr:PREDICTED: transcription factor CP2-like protein 1 isoform X3 [Myotis brandtii]
MLFWHNQLEHLWPSPGELYPGPPSSLLRESLPLPYLKQEELPNIPSMEPPCPSFQYVLCAATSPAVKQQEEALTYLNQGQSYEVQMLCNSKLGDATQWPRMLKMRRLRLRVSKLPPSFTEWQSVVRVVFHDRRLQYTEQQQLDGWRWSRPGDRILDIDVPLSVGVIEPQVLPSQLNTVEFHWDPTKRTSLFLQVHCISTEFTPRKKGGEKGVPFRLQIDTFKPSDKGLPPEHLHSAGCLIKVFKPKGADRKLKTDREKVEKQPLHERDKYQAACESTVFVECSPWPEPSAEPHLPLSPQALTSPHSCKLLSPERLCCSPPFILDTLGGSPAESVGSWCSLDCPLHASGSEPWSLHPGDAAVVTSPPVLQLLPDTSQFHRPIRHRLTLYVAQEASRQEKEVPKNPALGFYQEISLDELSAIELMGKLAELLNLPASQIHRLFHQGPGGILILLSDQVVQNLKDESYFVAVVKKGRSFRGRQQLCQRQRSYSKKTAIYCSGNT